MKFTANDCLTDRRSVLEDERQHSQEKFYVPACTPDGRYHRVQCYSGYCWCVYQDTGKPIPGTSSKNHTPNCNPVPTPSRPMKGNLFYISYFSVYSYICITYILSYYIFISTKIY